MSTLEQALNDTMMSLVATAAEPMDATDRHGLAELIRAVVDAQSNLNYQEESRRRWEREERLDAMAVCDCTHNDEKEEVNDGE